MNITQIIMKNAAELTALGRIKIRVRSDYADSTAMGSEFFP